MTAWVRAKSVIRNHGHLLVLPLKHPRDVDYGAVFVARFSGVTHLFSWIEIKV